MTAKEDGKVPVPFTEKERNDDFGRYQIPEYPSCLSECCSFTCMICAFCCCRSCLNPSSQTTRVLAICSAAILISVVVVSVIQYSYYKAKVFHFSPTDELPVTDGLSPAFCNEFVVDSSGEFSAYRFDKEPRITPNPTSFHKWVDTVFIDQNEPVVKDVYLLSGSTMTLKICPDFPLRYCAIKGQSAFSAWAKNKSSRDNCFQRHHFKARECRTFPVEAILSERIYFVFEVDSSPTWADVTFSVEKTGYDVTTAVDVCSDRQHCQFSLPYHSLSTIVVASSVNGGSETVLKTHCNPGIVFYMFVFFVPPVAVVIICLILLIKTKQREDNRRRIQDELAPIIRRHDGKVNNRMFKSNLLHYQTFQVPGINKSEKV